MIPRARQLRASKLWSGQTQCAAVRKVRQPINVPEHIDAIRVWAAVEYKIKAPVVVYPEVTVP